METLPIPISSSAIEAQIGGLVDKNFLAKKGKGMDARSAAPAKEGEGRPEIPQVFVWAG